MTPEQIANIEAAKKRRAALSKPAPTGKASISDKQKIELALKAINDYQRARQDPESLPTVLSGIFAKTPGDPELRNYSLNYDKKEMLLNRANEIASFIKQSPLPPEQKAKYMELIAQVNQFTNKLPQDAPVSAPVMKPQSTRQDQDIEKEIKARIAGLNRELASAEAQYNKALLDYVNTKKMLTKGMGIPAKYKDEIEQKGKLVDGLKKKKEDIEGKIAEIEAELKPAVEPEVEPEAPPVAKPNKEMDPAEFMKKYASELGDLPPEDFEQLNESSTTLLKTMAIKTGLPQGQLEQFWELAVQKNSAKSQIKDTAFWAGVMKEFQTLIDKVDIEEAKNIMETKEKYKEAANSFLNNLADDNYIGAEESFKTMMDTRLSDNISLRAEKYCQDILSKEAQKLAHDQ
jgi:hypothetical protein